MSIKPNQILPLILIVIDVFAAIGYLQCRNYRMVIYWLAAATLTTVVTF